MSVLAKEYSSYMEKNKLNSTLVLNKQNMEFKELNLSVPSISDSKNQSKLTIVSKTSEKPMIKEMEI